MMSDIKSVYKFTTPYKGEHFKYEALYVTDQQSFRFPTRLDNDEWCPAPPAPVGTGLSAVITWLLPPDHLMD